MEPVSDENPETHTRILELYSRYGIPARVLIHAPTKTSEESALVRGVSLASGAKAMLIKLPSSPPIFKLVVLSAAVKLSWKAVKKLLNSKKAELANEEEVKSITKCIPGAVPPFGSLFGIETLIDKSIVDQGEEINFNAGLRTHSLSMKVTEYLEVEKGRLCEISTKD